jgi:hydrogenase-4 component F
MMGFGMLSFLVAAFFLHRQKDIKRLFSYSSIEHMEQYQFLIIEKEPAMGNFA